MFTAEVSRAEAAVADYALGEFFAVLVRAAGFSDGHGGWVGRGRGFVLKLEGWLVIKRKRRLLFVGR